MPKFCDNDVIMFLFKGEALVNSEEYAGVTRCITGEFIHGLSVQNTKCLP